MLIPESSLADILKNQIYIGNIFVKDSTPQLGFYVKGIHQPLATKETFNKAQENIKAKKISVRELIQKAMMKNIHSEACLNVIIVVII